MIQVRTRWFAMVIPFLVTMIVPAVLAWSMTSGVAQAATCDVPTGTNPTIQSAVDDSGCDTINLTAALYVENVTINRSLEIQGQGALTTTVDGGASGSVFTIQLGTSVTITRISITNGQANFGGGINNNGNTTLNEVAIKGNTVSIDGGGIYNCGNLTINNSAISGNESISYSGAGMFNMGGDVYINNSTVSGNTAVNDAGAIHSDSGTVQLRSSTVTANASTRGGGGITEIGSKVNLQNSLVIGNNGSSSNDCGGTFHSDGYNLIGDTVGCKFLSDVGDLLNQTANLGSFQGDPGYHPLFIGPGVNAGDPFGCEDHLGQPLVTDQKGMPRVGRCDMGAYEYQGEFHQIFAPVAFNNFCPDFFDDFSNPGSGWSVGEDGYVRFGYVNGEYQIRSKRSGYIFFFRAPTCLRQNYEVEADARWVGTPGSSYGLLFGIKDSSTEYFNQFFLFDVNTDYRDYRLLRINANGSVTAIVPITSNSAIKGGNATNHLKVTRNGNQIILEVNGTVLGSWTNGAINGLTDVGIVAGPYGNYPTSDARFDNFSMIDLDRNGAYSTGQVENSTPRRNFDGQNDTGFIQWPGWEGVEP